MNDTNSEVNSGVSSEGPEFVWTGLCQTSTQKPVSKTDTSQTDQDSEHQACFTCVVVRCGDVECTKQDMVSLSAIQSESYTWTTRGARTIHTDYLDRDRIERCMTKMRMLIVRAWVGEQSPVVSGTGVTIGELLLKGHSWTTCVVLLITVGAGLLSCVCCIRSAPANWKCRSGTTAKRHDFGEHANQDHQPREGENVESLMVF